MKTIAFVDHEIGYRLLGLLLEQPFKSELELLAVATTEENGSLWWPGVEEIATCYNLPLIRYPREGDNLTEFEGVELFLLLSWKHLMPREILRIPQMGTINLHYSLLPKYRGVYPVNWALIRGEKETGITYHWVDSRIDAGAIIRQESLPIAPDDTARSLQLKLDDLALQAFPHLSLIMDSYGRGQVDSSAGSPRDYFSRDDFVKTNEIDLARTIQSGDLINLLRGKSFQPHGHNAFFVDPNSGRKVYVSIELKAEV